MISAVDVANNSYGNASDKVYNDCKDLEEIEDLIQRFKAKRLVDKFFIDWTTNAMRDKAALVLPPLIYGKGTGPVNTRSIQVPDLAQITLQNGTGYQVGAGLSTWSNVHIVDLGKLFLALVENAVDGNWYGWNEHGLYFAENGSLVGPPPLKHRLYSVLTTDIITSHSRT